MSGQAIVRIRDHDWLVALATNPWEQSSGLGGVPSIPVGTGMLFDLGYLDGIPPALAVPERPVPNGVRAG